MLVPLCPHAGVATVVIYVQKTPHMSPLGPLPSFRKSKYLRAGKVSTEPMLPQIVLNCLERAPSKFRYRAKRRP